MEPGIALIDWSTGGKRKIRRPAKRRRVRMSALCRCMVVVSMERCDVMRGGLAG